VLGPEPDSDQRRQIAALDGVEVVAGGLPLDWLADGPAPCRTAAQTVSEIVARESCDLVHLNSPLLAAEVQYPVPVVTVAHGCISTWWEAARSGPLDPAFVWHRSLSARGLRNSNVVIAPTRAYADTLRRCYGLTRPIEAVHNGRTMPAPAAPCAPHDFAFTAGRLWDDVKNARVLDAIAEHLTFPFHAAGAAVGPHGERFEPSHLHLLGQISEAEMAKWLARRPVFVSAAVFEPFGLAVLEAAQAGCPLVLSDIATFRELWDGAAIFVAPNDVDGFVAAVAECVTDQHLRLAWGERARARARSYTPAAMGATMAQIYNSLLEQKAAA
jgi:glycosyltransferase involved in cell wall biosynthesis